MQLTELRVDGGMVGNDLLMQFQADMLGRAVVRPRVTETTALGAAYAAGLAVGYWESREEIRRNWSEARRWAPAMDGEHRERLYGRWQKAVGRTLDWLDPMTGQPAITQCSGRSGIGFGSLDRNGGLCTHDRGDRLLFRRTFAASCQALGLALFTRQFLLPLVMAEVNFRHNAGRCLPAAAAAAATTAVAAATTAAAAAAAVAAATTAAATAAGLVLRFIDAQSTTAHVLAVDGLDGARSISLAHLDEAEAAGATGFAIHREGNRLNGAVRCEQRADLIFGSGKRQIADINLGHVAHLSL